MKNDSLHKPAIAAEAVAVDPSPSNYPMPFAIEVAGRRKQRLGDYFGLTNWGMNRTTLPPGAKSALLHRHSHADEMIYVLSGHPTLVTSDNEQLLAPGMCAGFPAGGAAHQIINRTDSDVVYLEIGDRHPEDSGSYPADDLVAVKDDAGGWQFTTKAGEPYD